MDCKNCKTELTEMKNAEGAVTCLRCMACHPMTVHVPSKAKENKRVDEPWTDERVIEIIDKVVPDMIREVLENWHIQKSPVAEVQEKTEVPWRDKAKVLGIAVYDKENNRPRKKVDVLKDIDKLTVPK